LKGENVFLEPNIFQRIVGSGPARPLAAQREKRVPCGRIKGACPNDTAMMVFTSGFHPVLPQGRPKSANANLQRRRWASPPNISAD